MTANSNSSPAPDAPDMASRISRMPNLLSAKQLIPLLCISRTNMYAMISAGSIPYFRLDGKIRFDPARIAAWLRAREIGGDEPMRKAA